MSESCLRCGGGGPFVDGVCAYCLVRKAPGVFTCPKCGRVSYNPNDVRERYCGACKEFIR